MRKLVRHGLLAQPLRTAVLIAVLYFAGALLGYALTPSVNAWVTLWPPAGLYLAVLLLAPYRLWPLLIIAAGAGHIAFDLLVMHMPLELSAGLWACNTVVTSLAAWLIPQALGERFRLRDLRSSMVFAAVAVLLAPALSATLSAALVDILDNVPWSASWPNWLFAEALGTLLVAPLLLADRSDETLWTGRRIEASALALALAAAVWLIFGNPGDTLPPVYLLPVLLWAAVRFGVWGGAAAFAATVIASMVLASEEVMQLSGQTARELAQQLEPRFTLFGLTLLLVAVLFREQQQAARALQRSNRALEQRVADRTETLARRERETRDRLGELESIYAGAPIGLAVLDRELRFVRVNELMARMNGRPAAQHSGRPIEEVLPALAPVVVPQLREVIESGEPRFGVEISGETPAQPGVTRDWIEHWLPLRDDGAIAGISVVCEEVSNLRRIQRALRESEMRFRRFAENLDAVLWMIDPASGRFLYVSPAYQELWGRSPDALLNDLDQWLLGVHPEDRAGVLAARREAIRDGRHDIEYRVLRPDGQTRWVRDRGFRFSTDDGAQYLAGIASDVSEDVVAEADLADSEHRFRLAARAAQGMVYEFNVASGHVYRSEGLRLLLGYAPEEVPPTAQWWAARVHPDDYQAANLLNTQALGSAVETIETEYRVRHRDGHWVHLWDRAYVDRDHAGQARRLIGHAVDITERRRHAAAQATLDRAGQQLAGARDAGTIAQVLVDALVPQHATWCVVRVEPRIEAPQAVARHAEELSAVALQPLLARWARGADGSALLARVLAGEPVLEPVSDGALDEPLPAGTALLHAVPLPGRERCLGVLVVGFAGGSERAAADHGELQGELVEELARRAALALENVDLMQTNERALAQLKAQDRRKTEFLSMLAHELRNPLTPIRNAAEVLNTIAPGKSQLSQISSVLVRQTQKMARLIDDLLDMARITHGKVKLERSHVPLRDVVVQAADATRALFAVRKQRLVADLPKQPVWVLGDALRLEQVLINLLSNAAKFGADEDRIEVALHREDGFVQVRVRDHGVGIAPDLLPHVFELFTQGERTPDRQQGGLGIGLSLVRSLVELHGGTVHASSDGPGRGAEFMVRLPAAEAPPQTVATPRIDMAGKLRVLVAEDNVDAGDTLNMLLTRNGYQVVLARSGPEAVALARQFRPQAVLLDIGLPGLDGFAVAQKLRDMGETAEALILAVSGYGDPDSRRRAHAVGINAYFVKPLDFQAALKELREREAAVG